MLKIQLALAGGLQLSDVEKPSENQRMIGLQELSKIIESTAFADEVIAVS